MKTSRVRIRFQSRCVTPLHSDTLFGHICWMYRYTKGEDALRRDILKGYDSTPSLLVSDGFPSGYLPCPKLPAIGEEDTLDLYEKAGGGRGLVPFLKRMKTIRKTRWILAADMLSLSDSLMPRRLAEIILNREESDGTEKIGGNPLEALVPHNTINRMSGTVDKAGGFFHSRENRITGLAFDIYLKINLPWDDATIQGLFADIGRWGYGADSSSGMGRFVVEEVASADLPEVGDAVLSLSHFVPDEELGEGWYDLEIKFGKLGGSYSQGTGAFPKTPMVLLRPGAVFRIKTTKTYYGRSLGPVHPIRRDVRNQTYLFPYFFNLKEN